MEAFSRRSWLSLIGFSVGLGSGGCLNNSNIELPYVMQWGIELHGRIHAISPTQDGGVYIVTGDPYSILGCSKVMLIKFDGEGNKEWQQKYSVIPGCTVINAIVTTSDGGAVLPGFYAAEDEREGHIFYSQGVVLKVDESGSVDWVKEIEKDQFGKIYSASVTGDDHVLIEGNDAMSETETIVRLNETGGLEWHKKLGQNSDDWLRMSNVTEENVVYLCGDTAAHKKGSQPWILKMDTTGEVLWETFLDRTIYRLNREVYPAVSSLDTAPDGGAYCVGRIRDIDEREFTYGYLLKVDDSGNTVWDEIIQQDSQSEYQQELEDIAVVGDRLIMIIKEVHYMRTPGEDSAAIVLETDLSGSEISRYRIGNDRYTELRTVVPSNDGGSYLLLNAGNNGWLIKRRAV